MHLSLAPRVFVAGGPIANDDLSWKVGGEPAVFAALNEQQMRRQVVEFSDRAAYAIKLGYLEDRPSRPPIGDYLAVLEAGIQAAHQKKMPVLVHSMTKDVSDALLDSGLDVYAHLPVDRPVSARFVSAVVAGDIAVTPTIAIFPRMADVLAGRFVVSYRLPRAGGLGNKCALDTREQLAASAEIGTSRRRAICIQEVRSYGPAPSLAFLSHPRTIDSLPSRDA
jgi:hypothetical protein